MSRHDGASHRELRNESPAKLRQQKPRTATLGVHDPLPSPECEDVHHRLAKEKNYMDWFWDFVAQTHVSLGEEGMLQEREKQEGLQAPAPIRSHCLAVRFLSQCQGSAATFRPGAKGSAACRISQNDGKGEAHGTPGLLGHFMVPASSTASAALRTKGWLGWRPARVDAFI